MVHEADQRAPHRHAGNEALGAVDRIEHPDIFGLRPVAAIFLADNAMGGKGLADQAAHRHFGGAVGLGHRIEDAALRFVLGADRAAEKRDDHFAGNLREPFDEGGEIDRGHRRGSRNVELSCEKLHMCHTYLDE